MIICYRLLRFAPRESGDACPARSRRLVTEHLIDALTTRIMVDRCQFAVTALRHGCAVRCWEGKWKGLRWN